MSQDHKLVTLAKKKTLTSAYTFPQLSKLSFYHLRVIVMFITFIQRIGLNYELTRIPALKKSERGPVSSVQRGHFLQEHYYLILRLV